MKRSEAIKTMIETYSAHPPSMSKEEKMGHVLKSLEAIGAVTPAYQEERGTGYSDEFGNETTTVDWVQGWEPESY